MRKWLRVRDNRHGEWSVTDLELGYRVCSFNHDHHGGAHVHHPLLAPAGMSVEVETAHEAEALIRKYRERHSFFHPDRFREVMQRWRFE